MNYQRNYSRRRCYPYLLDHYHHYHLNSFHHHMSFHHYYNYSLLFDLNPLNPTTVDRIFDFFYVIFFDNNLVFSDTVVIVISDILIYENYDGLIVHVTVFFVRSFCDFFSIVFDDDGIWIWAAVAVVVVWIFLYIAEK